jgi:hypothetical protein
VSKTRMMYICEAILYKPASKTEILTNLFSPCNQSIHPSRNCPRTCMWSVTVCDLHDNLMLCLNERSRLSRYCNSCAKGRGVASQHRRLYEALEVDVDWISFAMTFVALGCHSSLVLWLLLFSFPRLHPSRFGWSRDSEWQSVGV